MIQFTVYGNPQALKRHRTVKAGKFMQQYDPSATDKQDFLAKVMEHRPEKPLAKPLQVIMSFSFSRPKSHYGTGKNSGKLKANAPVTHISRPDVDNLAKFVLDALNGVYWKDDSVICSMTIDKTYSEVPKTTVNIYELE